VVERDLSETLPSRNFRLKQRNLDFLNTINPDNLNEALRIALDECEMNRQRVRFDQFLLTLGMGLLFVCLSLVMANVYLLATMMLAGVGILSYGCFSFYMARKRISETREKRHELEGKAIETE
jgi:hypothetical protein